MTLVKRLLVMVALSVSSMQLLAQLFHNPILAGFYPDPSICRAGDDYYIVNSSFAYYPGLPIFHSKDLLNWQQIGSALNRPEQLNLDGAGVSRGLFAPSISYHNGLFYIVCTLIDKGGNFVVTATDPKGSWSNPVWLPQVNGIDPSLFFDDNGRSYIVYNSIPPNNKSMHDGHRTIRINQFYPETMKVDTGNRIIVNGGTDMAKKPVWIEAPHIFKKDGWYYLICAEGGTGYNHSEVVFRTRDIDSAFISYDKNPILTQRQLDPNRKYPITTAGHAQMVQARDGHWWAVFLACRPYEGDYYNTGRETFMAPVGWKDGWPIINPQYAAIQYRYPIAAASNALREKFNGNFLFKDGFEKGALNNRYVFLRTLREDWYSIQKGMLEIRPRLETCSGKGNPSFIGFRQSHIKGHVATSLQFSPKDSTEKAGLVIFQNEQHYYFICKSIKEGKPVVKLFQSGSSIGSEETEICSKPLPLTGSEELRLKIEARGSSYAFYYAAGSHQWQLLKADMDARFLSTKIAGGFVGSIYGMYATSNNGSTATKAYYDWFESKNDDEMYK